MVCEFEPSVGLCSDSVEPASDSLSLSLPLPTSKINKHFFKFLFFNIYLFLRKRGRESKGGAERDRVTEDLK